MWLRDAVILNIKFMVDSVLNKGEGAVVAWGTDDTIKKAGCKVLDSKSNQITVKGPNMDKQTFTTEFDPNLSHKGYDSASSIDTKFKILDVLTSFKMFENTVGVQNLIYLHHGHQCSLQIAQLQPCHTPLQ